LWLKEAKTYIDNPAHRELPKRGIKGFDGTLEKQGDIPYRQEAKVKNLGENLQPAINGPPPFKAIGRFVTTKGSGFDFHEMSN